MLREDECGAWTEKLEWVYEVDGRYEQPYEGEALDLVLELDQCW